MRTLGPKKKKSENTSNNQSTPNIRREITKNHENNSQQHVTTALCIPPVPPGYKAYQTKNKTEPQIVGIKMHYPFYTHKSSVETTVKTWL